MSILKIKVKGQTNKTLTMSITKVTTLIDGICRLKYQYKDNVSSITEGDDGTMTVVFNTQLILWQELYCTAGSISCNEEMQDDNAAGPYYKQNLQAIAPGEAFAKVVNWNELCRHELILLLEYSNGSVKLLGSMDNPVLMKTKHNNGDNKQTEITVDRISEMPMPLMA
jgi:hypothetical protein